MISNLLKYFDSSSNEDNDILENNPGIIVGDNSDNSEEEGYNRLPTMVPAFVDLDARKEAIRSQKEKNRNDVLSTYEDIDKLNDKVDSLTKKFTILFALFISGGVITIIVLTSLYLYKKNKNKQKNKKSS